MLQYNVIYSKVFGTRDKNNIFDKNIFAVKSLEVYVLHVIKQLSLLFVEFIGARRRHHSETPKN